MSDFINKILGRDGESASHSQSSASKHETQTSIHNKPAVDSRTVQHEGVNIKSTVSSDVTSTVSIANQQKLNELVSKLGSTHSQIDQYAKKQSEKINDEIQREIDGVVTRTRLHQEELLKRANEKSATIDAEYRARLQVLVEEVDAAKAKRIAEIEGELNKQQADILQGARDEIDQLNQKAAAMKIGILQQAQARAAADADVITAEATNLSQALTQHQSKGTTTIKTQVTAATTTKEIGDSTTRDACASTVRDNSGTKITETTRVQTQQKK